jgi:hypothetical protein
MLSALGYLWCGIALIRIPLPFFQKNMAHFKGSRMMVVLDVFGKLPL